MLDGAVIDYCRVTALLSVEDWAFCVKGQKLTFGQLEESGAAKLTQEAVDRYMQQLEREPSN